MSLSQQAYLALKQKIVTLKLAPGSVINEAQLLDELGLGRTPVREALQRLAREQLVTIVPRRGMFVADIDLTDLHRLFEMRVPLEALAVQLAALRGQPNHWEAMRARLAEAHKLGEGERNQLMDVDHACHAIFWAAADNPFLEDSLTVLYTWSLRLWYYALPVVENLRQTVMEHEVMLSAVQAGHVEAATRLMQDHIRGFQVHIQDAILNKVASPERTVALPKPLA